MCATANTGPAHLRLFGLGVETLLARRAHNPDVSGSNPLPATIFDRLRQIILESPVNK
jgi:hypothetical protein